MEQEREINNIKEKYGNQCKVIKDVGDFKHVVVIRPTDIDIVVKFQLPGDYPSEAPSVVVRSASIAVDYMPEVTAIVDTISEQKSGSPTIDIIVQKVLQHLKQLGLGNPVEVTETKKKSNKKHRLRKGKTNFDETRHDTPSHEKKPSMRTAEDVIKRIQWDESIQTDHFLVGYLDRFTGIMERAFGAFSWEDLASADYTVLAIPKHRIQYFKYKEVIVWDKNKRLDHVFGSVGKAVTIHDVIDNYELYKSVQIEQHLITPELPACDDSDEDDVEIVTGFQAHDTTEQTTAESCRIGNNLRPTHFVCVRVTNPEVLDGVEAMQDAILEKEPRYASCCIRPSALHLTLCTVGLDNADEISKACQALEKLQPNLVELAKHASPIRVEGVDNFFDRVVYARAHHDIYFTEFVGHLRQSLTQAGVEIRDNHGYVPHITIMKTSREISREMRTSKVDTRIYEWFSDMYFGSQLVDKIHLCEMSNERTVNGFYVTNASITVQKLHCDKEQ